MNGTMLSRSVACAAFLLSFSMVLCDEGAEVSAYVRAGKRGAGRLDEYTISVHRGCEKSEEITCDTLKAYVEEHAINKIDYVSIVEAKGNELDVLRTLSLDSIDVTTIDFSSCDNEDEIGFFLEKKGYEFVSLQDDNTLRFQKKK